MPNRAEFKPPYPSRAVRLPPIGEMLPPLPAVAEMAPPPMRANTIPIQPRAEITPPPMMLEAPPLPAVAEMLPPFFRNEVPPIPASMEMLPPIGEPLKMDFVQPTPRPHLSVVGPDVTTNSELPHGMRQDVPPTSSDGGTDCDRPHCEQQPNVYEFIPPQPVAA
jgi:hypothetical protein